MSNVYGENMVKMKIEQKIVAIYTVIGAVSGLISNYLTAISVFWAAISAFMIYFGTVLPILKAKEGKKKKSISFNAAMTFFLVWATVWVFLFNL